LLRKILLLAALASFLPVTALASPVLTQPTGTTVATGTKFRATDTEGGATWTNTSGGIIYSCSRAELTGDVVKNSGSALEANVSIGDLTGTGADGNCIGTFFSEFNVTLGIANGLPWCIRTTSTMAGDEAQLRGGKCSETAREIRFALDFEGLGATCLFKREAAITGTYATDTTGYAVVRISKSLFSPVSAPFPCPEEFLLDLNLTMETDSIGGTVSPLYIS
jgi:hypothetical protein